MIPPDMIRVTKAGTKYFLDRVEVTEKEYRQRHPLPETQGLSDGSSFIGWRPLASEALAVHPLQRQEAIDSAIRKGVPTEFNTIGQPVFTSRKHRRDYLRAYNYRDEDGGYGDG